MTTESPAVAAEPAASDVPPLPAAAGRIDSRRAHRATVLAELKAVEKPKADEPEPKAEPAKDPEKPPAVAKSADDADEDEDDEPAAAKASIEVEKSATPDADTSKRLAAVQAEEKRARAKVAAERAEVAAERAAAAKERAEIDADRAALAEYRKAAERAAVDPVAALRSLGLKDEGLEDAARQVYAAAKGTPATKADAARMMRDKERDAEIAELKKWREERTTAEKTQTQEAAARAAADAWFREFPAVVKTAESPLAKLAAARSPAKLEAALRRITLDMLQAGEEPEHVDVLARYETQRRAELDELGVDIDSILKTPKKPDPEAVKKTAAKTLNNDMSTPTTVPRSESSDKEQRAKVRAALEAGKLE